MTNLVKPGKYVVAVSGGVDSVVLLDMLVGHKNCELIVAHFDHGIRVDSVEDKNFVEALAKKYDLSFYCKREELGSDASEAKARDRRYQFLNEVLAQTNSDAIITAHHQDDLIETALLNVLRGTKRKGLVSLKSEGELLRPLLSFPKEYILKYAKDNNLDWREDKTNTDTRYKRNEIRNTLKNSLTEEKRKELIKYLDDIQKYDSAIATDLQLYLGKEDVSLNKSELLGMQENVASEVTAAWLRNNKVSFDKNTIYRIIQGAKNLNPGAQIDVKDNYYCLVGREHITLKQRKSV